MEHSPSHLPPPEPDALLERPLNKTTQRFFVAATRQNEGKTTVCLGLFGALRAHYPRMAFIKPVGQRFVTVHGFQIDEDTVLLDSIYHVQVPIEAMSPIAVDSNFTRRFLKDPDAGFPVLTDKMCRAFDRTAYEKDAVIIEGTGHAGVGSVFQLSNAHVARMLDAKVIIVSGGGIGRPVDEIALNKALFDQYGVTVAGAILNKVHPEKMETVTEYAGLALARMGVPLLGVLPTVKQLAAPSLRQAVSAVDGRWLNACPADFQQRVSKVIVGAMTAQNLAGHLEPGALLITPGDRGDLLSAAADAAGPPGKRLIAGIILDRGTPPRSRLMERLTETGIPAAICGLDSYAIASKIHSMTVKIQPRDTDKIPMIQKLVHEHIDLTRLLEFV